MELELNAFLNKSAPFFCYVIVQNSDSSRVTVCS